MKTALEFTLLHLTVFIIWSSITKFEYTDRYNIKIVFENELIDLQSAKLEQEHTEKYNLNK